MEKELSTRYATFHVGDLFFGIEVLKVQELLRYQEVTRVPLAHPVIEGLINLRGQIVTAVDMRRRLKIEPRQTGQPPMNIVVRSGDNAVSLLVDEIGDVLEVARDSCEAPPDTLRAEEKEIVEGVCKLEGKLLLTIDTEKLLRSFSETPAGQGGAGGILPTTPLIQ
jgi:purine-binding chemotaxis protein CheW